MRPSADPRSRSPLPQIAGLLSDLAILAGCAGIAGAAWLVDLRLGLFAGGLLLVGLGFLVAPRAR